MAIDESDDGSPIIGRNNSLIELKQARDINFENIDRHGQVAIKMIDIYHPPKQLDGSN